MTEDTKIKIEPEFNRALAVWHESKPFEAIKILQKLEKQNPKQPIILGMIAAIYHELKDWTQCLIYSEKAAKFLPNSERFSTMLFHSLWNKERFDEAFEEAKRFINLNGFSKEYNFILKEINENKEPN